MYVYQFILQNNQNINENTKCKTDILSVTNFILIVEIEISISVGISNVKINKSVILLIYNLKNWDATRC